MIRTVEMFLFDTCTHKCAYCHFAETGKVLDASQIRPYRDPDFIDAVVAFFNSRTFDDDRWLVILTGGEPLLMPNLHRFAAGLWNKSNRIAFCTALLVGDNHPGFRFLLEHGRECTDHLMVSFHPEAEEIEEEYFRRLGILKDAGHSIILRLVGHPDRLHRLPELAARCRDLDISFHPTPLFSPEYPARYSPSQRQALDSYAVSLSQIIQLEGGVDTSFTLCNAGSVMFAVDMRTGNITPCISIDHPILGNIYDNDLRLMDRSIGCPKRGIACICDVHFQQSIVHGADDRQYFDAEKRGFVSPIDPELLRNELASRQIRFSKSTPTIGQTATAEYLSLETRAVKAAFADNKSFLMGEYAASNHLFFKSRQFGHAPPPSTADGLADAAGSAVGSSRRSGRSESSASGELWKKMTGLLRRHVSWRL